MAHSMFRRWKPPLPDHGGMQSQFVHDHWQSFRATMHSEPHPAIMSYIETILACGREGDDMGIYEPNDYAFAYRVFQVITMGKELSRNARA